MACIIIIINEWLSYINIPNINITNIRNIIISNISVGIKNLFKDNSKIMINGNGSSFTNKNGSMGVKSFESSVDYMDNSQEQIGKGKRVDESSQGPSKPFSKDELAEHNLKDAKLTEENLKKFLIILI